MTTQATSTTLKSSATTTFCSKRQTMHLQISLGKRVTKVLTAAVDGIPLATMVANALGVNLIVAKRNKEVGVKAFIDETYILGRDSGVTVTLYIPKEAIKKRDSVLIVDDMIKSGETQEALVTLVKKSKAEVSGIFSLIAVGEEWKKRLKSGEDSPVEVVTAPKIAL